MARASKTEPRLSKVTGRPVDPKRSRAAKKAAMTRKANAHAAEASRLQRLRPRHKLAAAAAIAIVAVLTFFGIRGQLDAYAASVSTGTLTNAAGLCLENANAKTVNDNNIRIYKCNGSAAQRWTFTGGMMKYTANNDYCFNVAGVNKKAVGAYIQLWKCNGKPEMQFSVHGTTLVNDPTGYCVTTKNGGTGSDQIIMKPCDGSSIQKFTFTATGTPAVTTPTPTPTSGSGSTTTSPCGSKDPGVVECTSGDPADTTTGSDSSYDSSTGGDGSGAATGNGVQQTGAGLSLWQDLKGDSFNARVNSAGSSKIVSLPAGTFAFSDFRIGDQGVKKGMSAYGTRLSVKGIVGAGVGKTIIQMTPKTSTKAKSQPASCGGGDGCPTNNLYLMAMTASGAKFDGITLKGTPQGHYYGGLLFARMSNPTLSNAKFTDIPGGSSANPDETFFVNFHRTSGKATIKNVSIEGGSVGAAGIAMNTCSSSFDIDNLYVDGLKYSAGIALWEQTGTINIHNWTNKNAPRALGAERLGGTVNIYDPNWAAPKKGHDITYTPYSGHKGRINFYFSSASKVPNRKIVILTNTSSVKNTVHVYVGGQEQDQSKYIGWKGI